MASPIGQATGLDTAVGIFRARLPEYGFKLVMPPPLAGGGLSHAFAAVWRRGAAQVISCNGATPALALLRATESELVKLSDAASRAACTRCSGLGWYVIDSETVRICRHGDEAAASCA